MKKNKIGMIAAGVIIVVIGIFYLYYQKPVANKNTDDKTNSGVVSSVTQITSQVANPASVNCKKLGGILAIQKRGDGGEYGLCGFEDNRFCEEWALMRGDCPMGGVKTTGYDTIEQKYCAWLGGKTLAVKDAICTFSDGSTCPDDEFYAGTCQKGNK